MTDQSALNLRQPPGKIFVSCQFATHPHKSADDVEAHLNGPRAVQDIGGQKGAVLSERPRKILAMLAASCFCSGALRERIGIDLQDRSLRS
jgi:hypothetical protein